MLARVLLLGLLALVGLSFPAWATGPANYPPGGSGSGVVANTCTSGDFFSAVDGSGNFTCATPAGSGDVTAVGDCASGACFDGTSGTTLTGSGASTVLQGTGSLYFNLDTNADSSGDGFVVADNSTGTGGTKLFEINESNNAYLYNNMALRFREATANGSSAVIVTGPASMTTSPTIAFPEASGTVAVSATSPLSLSAAGDLSITADGIGSSQLAATFTATTITSNLVGNVTGNADTATTATTANAGDSATSFFSTGELERTLLPAASADCSASNWVKGVDADFVLDCSQPAFTNISGSVTDAQVPNNITVDLATLATTATTANAGDSATSFFSSGELERTLLPAASADCSASNWAKGIDADLVLDCSQPAFTDISGTAAATQITKINSTSCTNGIQTASDGTVSCLTASSTPEFVSRVMTAGGTLGNYAVVMADGSDDDEVIEATTSTTQILGCSQDSDGTTSTNPVEVAVAGIARCKADTTVTAGSLVKLGATGEFSLATTAERTWGRAVTDDDAGSASAYILLFDGAEGTIDHKIDVWPSIPDLTTNTETALSVAPTVDISSTGTLKGISVAPDTDTAAGGTVKGIVIEPTLTQAGTTAGPNFYGLEVGGTVNVTNTTHLGSAYAFVNDTAFTSPTAGSTPVLLQYGFWNKPSMTMTASSSSATSTGFISVMHNPTWVLNSTGGGASASYSVNEDVGVKMNGTYTKTAGTALTVSLRDGLQMNDPSTSGSPVVTEVNGLNVKALTVGTTISAVKSALAPASNNYFLNDTGGAQSKFTGKITTYNNVATVQGGVPSIVANVALTAQTASIAATTLYAVPASQGGMYRVCYHAFRTRAATTSSTLGPITFTATQTVDSVNRTWPQASITNISTNTTNTTAGQYANCLVLEAKASTNIQYIMGYTSSGATTMEYALYITAERLQG